MYERISRYIQVSSFLLAATLILLPVLLVFVYAFNAAERGMVWTGLSLKWVGRILEDQASMLALRNSLVVASLVSLGAWLTAIPLAFALGRLGSVLRVLVGMGLLAVVLSPDLAIAIAQARTLQTLGGSPGLFAIAAGQLPFATGYLAILVIATAETLRPEAALLAADDLGATPLQTLRMVFIPLTRPGWIAGTAVVFALSFQDFIFSFHLGGAGSSTLAVRIYSMLRRGISPGINMLFLIMLGMTVLGMALFFRTQHRMETPS